MLVTGASRATSADAQDNFETPGHTDAQTGAETWAAAGQDRGSPPSMRQKSDFLMPNEFDDFAAFKRPTRGRNSKPSRRAAQSQHQHQGQVEDSHTRWARRRETRPGPHRVPGAGVGHRGARKRPHASAGGRRRDIPSSLPQDDAVDGLDDAFFAPPRTQAQQRRGAVDPARKLARDRRRKRARWGGGWWWSRRAA